MQNRLDSALKHIKVFFRWHFMATSSTLFSCSRCQTQGAGEEHVHTVTNVTVSWSHFLWQGNLCNQEAMCDPMFNPKRARTVAASSDDLQRWFYLFLSSCRRRGRGGRHGRGRRDHWRSRTSRSRYAKGCAYWLVLQRSHHWFWNSQRARHHSSKTKFASGGLGFSAGGTKSISGPPSMACEDLTFAEGIQFSDVVVWSSCSMAWLSTNASSRQRRSCSTSAGAFGRYRWTGVFLQLIPEVAARTAVSNAAAWRRNGWDHRRFGSAPVAIPPGERNLGGQAVAGEARYGGARQSGIESPQGHGVSSISRTSGRCWSGTVGHFALVDPTWASSRGHHLGWATWGWKVYLGGRVCQSEGRAYPFVGSRLAASSKPFFWRKSSLSSAVKHLKRTRNRVWGCYARVASCYICI